MHRTRTLATGLTAALLLCGAVQAAAEISLVANHDHITIDFFYHGSSVSARGTTEPGTDVIVKIAGPDGVETLKQKGKTAGVLWMNVGTLHFENAPNLYEVYSTRPIEQILAPEEADREVLGYRALGKHLALEPVTSADEREKWVGEFIRFKEDAKLYGGSTGAIALEPKDGRQGYYIKTEWPFQAPPGDYTVTAYAVRDGKVIEKIEKPVDVKQVGIVRTLSKMAKNNGALYGLLSIAMALGAGFGVGLIFRKGGGAH
jgi:uncharacterized protein (TIGR02186 family)